MSRGLQTAEITVFYFSLLRLFWKNKSRLMISPCCLCLWISLINFWIPDPVFIKLDIFMKLDIHIMTSESISAAYLINLSHQSVYPSSVARQRLCKSVTAATNTHAKNRRIVGHVVFYAVQVVWKESRLLILQRTSCFTFVFHCNEILKNTSTLSTNLIIFYCV
jgi:hypothetical protein